jgi:hypothetical protein
MFAFLFLYQIYLLLILTILGLDLLTKHLNFALGLIFQGPKVLQNLSEHKI